METIKTLELTQEAIEKLSYALFLQIDNLRQDNMINPLPKREVEISKLQTLLNYLESL